VTEVKLPVLPVVAPPIAGPPPELMDYFATFRCIKMTGNSGSLGDGSM